MPRIARTGLSQDYNDLRRASAAMHENNDCSVIAIAIACNVTYEMAHAACKKHGRVNRQGTFVSISEKAIYELGYKIRKWTDAEKITKIHSYPGAHKGLSAITSHHLRRFPAAWRNVHRNMIWASWRHMFAVKDGIVRDWSTNSSIRVNTIWEVEPV